MDKIPSTKFSSADLRVLKKLLFITVAMFVFPIGTFFMLRHVLPKDQIVLPVGASVIAVHIVIGIYVWMAIKEGDGDEKAPLKED